MATHDLKLGPTMVLLVFTDDDAATRVLEAIEAEREHLFQCDGPFSVLTHTDRDAAVEKPHAHPIHALPVSLAVAMIAEAATDADVRELLDAEHENPRAQGPRVSVVAAANARLESEAGGE